jgi:hypothetical protein
MTRSIDEIAADLPPSLHAELCAAMTAVLEAQRNHRRMIFCEILANIETSDLWSAKKNLNYLLRLEEGIK